VTKLLFVKQKKKHNCINTGKSVQWKSLKEDNVVKNPEALPEGLQPNGHDFFGGK